MKINHRKYRGEEDNRHVRKLLSQNYAATQHPYFAADPPNWERLSVRSKIDPNGPIIHLWELTENPLQGLVGMVLYQKHQGEFSCLVHPHYRGIEDMMYDWVETKHQAAQTGQSEQKPPKCSVCERNEIQKEILSRRGYTRGKLGVVFRKRFLDEANPGMPFPEGYSVHKVQALSEEQFVRRAQVESKVFGGTITVSFLRELQEAPIYRPDLDLVMKAPDGEIAAFCTIWFDEEHNAGFYEPIGTVSAHRRYGLGKALMMEGFRRLQGMGASVAYLGHGADNHAGERLYESVGMSVFDREYWWHSRDEES